MRTSHRLPTILRVWPVNSTPARVGCAACSVPQPALIRGRQAKPVVRRRRQRAGQYAPRLEPIATIGCTDDSDGGRPAQVCRGVWVGAIVTDLHAGIRQLAENHRFLTRLLPLASRKTPYRCSACTTCRDGLQETQADRALFDGRRGPIVVERHAGLTGRTGFHAFPRIVSSK